MSVRAKFKVESYSTRLYQRSSGTDELRTINLTPVGSDNSPENKEFWMWTPVGKIELGTINPGAWAQFELGKEFYVDFTPAD